MNYFKSFFKISIILLLLIISVGSIYAADTSDSTLTDNQDDDFVLDEDIDDGSDDLEVDDSGDDNSDDYYSDDEDAEEDDDDYDSDDEDDEEEDDDYDSDDEDDEEDDDWEDEDDYDDENDSEVYDFDFLEYKILVYLEKYGNCTDENWTESDDFLNEYQIYLSDPSNYTLNESAEGYNTYMKIYNSIVSTFGEYNLTENETEYLKFLIIYYLNHYGNVSANYTWNESDEFENFVLPKYLLGAYYFGSASGSASMPEGSHVAFKNLNNLFYPTLATSTDLNKTVEDNSSSNAVNMAYGNKSDDNSLWTYIIVLFLALTAVILIFRKA